MAEPFYITTAISYPNGPPHIGHAYEAIAADAIARFQRSQGRDVRFQTGTDEHGLKMAQAARARRRRAARTSRRKCRDFSKRCATLLTYRTIASSGRREPDHYRASQAIWKAMEERGDLYLDRYEGWYSVRDEAYYDEERAGRGRGRREAVAAGHAGRMDGRGELVLPPVQISAAVARPLCGQSRLHPARKPPQRGRCASSRAGSRTCSISRTSFDWGVPVPGSDEPRDVRLARCADQLHHRPRLSRRYRAVARYWPADVHLIGKDVVRFHAVYWPAFLMSRGNCAAEAGLRPRLPAQPRRENVEERRQRRRPDGAGRPLRGRCAALFPAARSHRSARTAATAPKRSSTAPMPSSPTASAISPSAHCR